MMKMQVVSHRVIVTILTMISLIYGVQSISYGQADAPTVTPGETNSSFVVRFQITLDEGVDENAYQIQVRRKTPLGEWISKCIAIKRGIRHETAGDPDVSLRLYTSVESSFTSGIGPTRHLMFVLSS